jgi:HSP20 family molecular chaperone IbpA
MRVTDLGRDAATTVLRGFGRAVSLVHEQVGVSADLLESDDEYLVVFDAPGATASDVDVRFDRGSVHVRIDRFREHREGFETTLPGRSLALDGSAELPADARVDPDAARAELRDDGTLYVFLPKTDAADSAVPVEAADDESAEA